MSRAWLALAHNGNLSNGIMFPIDRQYTGKKLNKFYVEQRAKWERMYEITQIKGDGETHPFLSPEDEFADYGTWDVGNLDISAAKTDDMLAGEYAREALKNGLVLNLDGQLWTVVEFQHVKPGKGGAFVRTKLKNLISGLVIDPTFRSGDKVKKPDLSDTEMQFLYSDGETYHFMDQSSYEQIEVAKDALGESADYMKENIEVSVLLFNGRPVGVDLPNFVELKITECDPGVKGDTVSGATKPATYCADGTWLACDDVLYGRRWER